MVSLSFPENDEGESAKMKALFFSFLILLGTRFCLAETTPPAPSKVVLGIVSEGSRDQFDTQFQSFFKEQWASCPQCELKNLTPYDAKGLLDRSALPKALEAAQGQIQLLFLSWNEAFTPNSEAILTSLKKLTASGILLIGPAGEPQVNKPSQALSRTLVGEVPDALIIGDLNERESLLSRSFYGPEMLTALKTSKDLPGAPSAAAAFSARLTREWIRKTNEQWVSHFRSRKSASRRIWPGLDEFFVR